MDQLIKKFDLYNFFVLYPINPNSPNASGQVGVMTAGLNQNDEVTVAIVKDGSGSWKPSEKPTSFEDEEGDSFISETIKRILQHRLDEQIVNIKLSSSSDPNKVSTTTSSNTSAGSTTTSGNQASTTQGKTEYKVDTKKLCSYVNPRREESIEILTKLKNMNLLGFPLLDADQKQELQSSINQMEKIDCATVCSPENTDLLSDAKKQINTLMTTNKNAKYIKKDLNRLLELIGQIEKECGRIQQEQKNYVGQPSVSTNQSTNQNQTASNQTASPKPDAGVTSGEQTTTPPDCSMTDEMLVNYIIDGLQGVKLNSA